MPTYSYLCDSCGHDFEAVQRFTEDPLTECPRCGAAIRRVIQPVGVVFKGSGWYITDNRSKGSSDREESGAKDKPDKSDESDKSDKAAKPDSASKPEKTDVAAKSDKTPAKVAD